jgi:hypothetical protein
VHDALGNPLAVEVSEFLDQVMILEQYRAARTGGARVLIVGNGGSAISCENPLEMHVFSG